MIFMVVYCIEILYYHYYQYYYVDTYSAQFHIIIRIYVQPPEGMIFFSLLCFFIFLIMFFLAINGIERMSKWKPYMRIRMECQDERGWGRAWINGI